MSGTCKKGELIGSNILPFFDDIPVRTRRMLRNLFRSDENESERGCFFSDSLPGTATKKFLSLRRTETDFEHLLFAIPPPPPSFFPTREREREGMAYYSAAHTPLSSPLSPPSAIQTPANFESTGEREGGGGERVAGIRASDESRRGGRSEGKHNARTQ